MASRSLAVSVFAVLVAVSTAGCLQAGYRLLKAAADDDVVFKGSLPEDAERTRWTYNFTVPNRTDGEPTGAFEFYGSWSFSHPVDYQIARPDQPVNLTRTIDDPDHLNGSEGPLFARYKSQPGDWRLSLATEGPADYRIVLYACQRYEEPGDTRKCTADP